jgi:hypothetical protein
MAMLLATRLSDSTSFDAEGAKSIALRLYSIAVESEVTTGNDS